MPITATTIWEVPLSAVISGEDRGRLKKGASQMEHMIRNYKKGDVIFVEGDLENAMYTLLEGVVGIYANYGKPGEKLLTKLKAENRATFGEMGLLNAMPRSATAVALEDVKACYITGETFGDYFCEDPAAILLIMRNMSKRIRELTNDYLDACRAVSELVESEKSGKGKSGWFRDKVGKFLRDYEAGVRAASEYGYDVSYHFAAGPFWY